MKQKSTFTNLILLSIPGLIALPLHAVSLSVTPIDDGETLAGLILGTGIAIVPGSVSYSGATTGASGSFSGGVAAGIGIEKGLIMTTGLATNAIGPNNSGSTTGAGVTSTLEFKFTSGGGDLFFNYVFASEEYNEFVFSSYNDKFKFFLDGTNIALIPGTSTPVEIDTVNLSVNPSLYNNNSSGAFDIEYDGFTKIFTATSLGLAPGEHTMSLTIFDVGDAAYDSAVFIQGNSFSDTTPPPPGGSVPDGGSTAVLLGTAILGLIGVKKKS